MLAMVKFVLRFNVMRNNRRGVTNDGDDDKALFGGISSFVLELPLGRSSLLLSR